MSERQSTLSSTERPLCIRMRLSPEHEYPARGGDLAFSSLHSRALWRAFRRPLQGTLKGLRLSYPIFACLTGRCQRKVSPDEQSSYRDGDYPYSITEGHWPYAEYSAPDGQISYRDGLITPAPITYEGHWPAPSGPRRTSKAVSDGVESGGLEQPDLNLAVRRVPSPDGQGSYRDGLITPAPMTSEGHWPYAEYPRRTGNKGVDTTRAFDYISLRTAGRYQYRTGFSADQSQEGPERSGF